MSAVVAVAGLAGVDYGQRFKELRERLWKGRRLLDVARALGSDYPNTVHNIESQWWAPSLPTITAHAKALGCKPWELLRDVETQYDRARALNDRDPVSAEREWRQLIERLEKKKRRIAVEPVREAGDTRPAASTGRHRRR